MRAVRQWPLSKLPRWFYPNSSLIKQQFYGVPEIMSGPVSYIFLDNELSSPLIGYGDGIHVLQVDSIGQSTSQHKQYQPFDGLSQQLPYS